MDDTVKLQQQSKNLRVNSAILNSLKKFDIQETMATDWAGKLQGNILTRSGLIYWIVVIYSINAITVHLSRKLGIFILLEMGFRRTVLHSYNY